MTELERLEKNVADTSAATQRAYEAAQRAYEAAAAYADVVAYSAVDAAVNAAVNYADTKAALTKAEETLNNYKEVQHHEKH